jgi:hypothetical protein
MGVAGGVAVCDAVDNDKNSAKTAPLALAAVNVGANGQIMIDTSNLAIESIVNVVPDESAVDKAARVGVCVEDVAVVASGIENPFWRCICWCFQGEG